jgi:hypothetical protein
MSAARRGLKNVLARIPDRHVVRGARVLIYHRVGGGSPDERDLPVTQFTAQLDSLPSGSVRHLDEALDDLSRDSIVLSFDDGFADIHANAWPQLRDRGLPFTVYVASAYVGGEMHWDGSTARAVGPGLTWGQLREMVESGLCTIGNHTHTHARPELTTAAELDRCSEELDTHLGVRPQHFAFTWGMAGQGTRGLVEERFRSSALGAVGVNGLGQDLHALRRIPVRQSDPLPFFRAKLRGTLAPERAYAAIVSGAKRAGARA